MSLEENKILKRKKKARDEENYDQLALQCHKLGEIRMNQGKYNDALKLFQESLAACEKLGIRVRRGCAHRMVGEAYVNLGEYQKALDHEKKYLDLVTKAGDVLEQQRAWASIGRSQLCLAESRELEADEEQFRKEAFAAAKNAFMKSLAIANEKLIHLSKRDLVEMKGRLILNLGLVQEFQGEVNEALKKLEKAVDLFLKNDLYDDLCLALGSLGSLRLKNGDCDGALKDLNRGLEVAKRLSSEEKQAKTCDLLSAKAEVFFTLGELTAAKLALHKAYKISPKNENLKETIEKNLRVVVTALQAEKQLQEIDENDWLLKKKLHENIADCCTEVKAYTKAVNHYKKMLECAETLGETGNALSTALISVGATYKDNKQYDLALEYFEREYELWEDNNPKEACRSLLTLASVFKLKKDPVRHQMHLERARTQAVLSESVKLHLEVLNELAAYHRAQGDEKTADEYENDILLYRGDTASSQEMSSQEQSGDVDNAIWDHTNIENLSSDDSDDEDTSKKTRLRPRTQCKVRRNEKGETALHTACIGGKIDQVQRLLDSDHVVNVTDNAGWTPLHEACNHGYVDIAEMLINKGANINHKGGRECDGITPLHDACSNGCFDVIELLLDKGAEVTAKTYKQRLTPYNLLVNWHREQDLLDDIEENNYNELCKRMKLILKKAGQNVSEDTDDSGSRSSRRESGLSSALRVQYQDRPEPGPSRRSLSPQPSTSNQSQSKRPSYENRAILDLRRKNKLRILSDASSQEDEQGTLKFGSLRRKADSTRKISSDEDEEERHTIQSSRAQQSTPSPESDGEEVQQPAQATVQRRSSDDSSATNEYARVMETLRGKNKHKGPELFTMKAKKPALLREEEIENYWLDDDMAQTQPTKKARIHSPTFPSQSKSAKSHRSNIVTFPRMPSPVNYEDMDADTEDIEPPSPKRQKASPLKRSPRKSPLKLSQRSLSERSLSPKKLPQRSFSPVKMSQRAMDQIELQIKVKVQVNDDKFLVPVPLKDLTFSWLADEVSQRYYRLKGLLPKLSLQTQDGAFLSPTDSISLLLSNKDGEPDEVQAKVESLTLPPITDRYKEACQNKDCGEDVHVLQCLEACQVTLSLQFCNLKLGDQSVPLLLALSRQHTLRELSLTGCALGDSEVEKLCPVLSTLEVLTSIDLSCNNVTKIGLQHLANLVSDGKSLNKLSSLNLSHNPLESSGFSLLGPLFDHLHSLTKLELRDCGLSLSDDVMMETFPSFSLDCLTELDVSYNALGCQGLGPFFGRIDAWQLSKLNIAYTVSPNQEEGSSIAREVALLLQKAVQNELQEGVISYLDISGCKLEDVDVYELINAMLDSNICVKHLVLSNNSALTAITLRYLLQHTPAFTSLTLTGCPGVMYPVQPEDLPPHLNMLRLSTKQREDSQALLLTWSQAKGDKAKNVVGPGGLVLLSVK